MRRLLSLPIVVITAGITFFSMYSCSEEFFETPTGNKFDPEDHYNYIREAANSYLGCFSYLQDISPNLVLVDGLRSDLMDVTENADKDMVSIYNQNISSDNKYLDLSDYYKVIINVNEVLPNLASVMEKDRDFDSVLYNGYKGALTTLRVWSYFMLAKINGEVGLVAEDVSNFDPSKAPVYLSKKEIIANLIEELLPYDDEDDRYRYILDHYALLGELYLEIREYSKAVYYLKKCIDGEGAYDYMLGARNFNNEDWYSMFVSSYDQLGSLISVVPFSAQENQPNPIEVWANIDYMIKPSTVIVDMYSIQWRSDGKQGDLHRGKGITYDISANNEPYIQKYAIDEGFPLSSDIIIYRPADIHLLLAEALNRDNQPKTALALLNLGIKQEDPKPDGYTRWAANRGVRGRISLARTSAEGVQAIEDKIMDERAMELAYEGKRFFDLVRIAQRRGDPSYLANRVAAKYTNQAQKNQVKNKLMNPNNWYVPLSKIE